jgi:hypothetical protein
VALTGGEGVSCAALAASTSGRGETAEWFMFNPSQHLHALFGWSSTYRGPV